MAGALLILDGNMSPANASTCFHWGHCFGGTSSDLEARRVMGIPVEIFRRSSLISNNFTAEVLTSSELISYFTSA